MEILLLTSDDGKLMRELIHVFAEAFEDQKNYNPNEVSDEHFVSFLSHPHHIVLVCRIEGKIVGGLVAYLLPKFEKPRKEIYIYDLAVSENHRRKKIATSLIQELVKHAKTLGAYVVYVQADYEDEPAVRLYESLGHREEVLHFDFTV